MGGCTHARVPHNKRAQILTSANVLLCYVTPVIIGNVVQEHTHQHGSVAANVLCKDKHNTNARERWVHGDQLLMARHSSKENQQNKTKHTERCALKKSAVFIV